MKRYPVEFREEAIDDIDWIHETVLDVSKDFNTATRFARRIYKQCLKIGDMPFGGAPRDYLQKGLRLVPFEKSAVILYVIENETVWITNVIYGGRDYEAMFRQSKDI